MGKYWEGKASFKPKLQKGDFGEMDQSDFAFSQLSWFGISRMFPTLSKAQSFSILALRSRCIHTFNC